MADPARSGAAGVSCRPEPTIWALPLTLHPPPGGATALCPGGGDAPLPVTGTVSTCVPWASVQVSLKVQETLPMLDGVNVTGTCRSSPGLRGRPAETGAGVPNGASGRLADATVAGRLPVLVMPTVMAACWPTGTEPKFTAAGDAVRALTPATAFPVRLTVTFPVEPSIVSDPWSGPPVVGAGGV